MITFYGRIENGVIFMKNALIFDIDGVVCDSSERLSRYADSDALERGDYHAFNLSMVEYNKADLDSDIPIAQGIDLLYALRNHYDIQEINPSRVIFLTARGEESRAKTFDWLKTWVYPTIESSDLIMRQESHIDENGFFCPVSYKRDEVKKLLENHRISIAVDDHLLICEKYQEIGVAALHVKFPGIDCISLSGANRVPVPVNIR